MKPLAGLAAVMAAFLIPAFCIAGAVRVDGGRVEGVISGDVRVYKGIPFAAPPIGDLRWKPPQRAPDWAGVRKADVFAPACMQSGVSMPGEAPPKTSEDCLYLNVWTPRVKAPSAVMVFIYGGGFMNGSAAMPLYWGDQLARKGVVVVTFGYRVGPLGFLAASALSKESADHTSGNYGLLDQIAALQWVKRNIGAFGGDPGRVTVFGQSAGAMSISLLAASPLAKGLTELRRLPAERFLGDGAAAVSHPVIDHYVLPKSPFDAFAEGRQADVPMLVGSNEEEGRALVDASTVKAASFKEDIGRAWGALPPVLLDAYLHATDAEARTARFDFERDLRFGWDMWLQAATGRHPVYYYHFTRQPPFPPGSVYSGWGASHYAELWYVFDHLDQAPWSWTAADRSLAEAMSTYWTNFAKRGDPNGPGLTAWPPFSGSGQVLYLGDRVSLGGVADLKTLTVFDAVYAQVRGAPVLAAPKNAAP